MWETPTLYGRNRTIAAGVIRPKVEGIVLRQVDKGQENILERSRQRTEPRTRQRAVGSSQMGSHNRALLSVQGP